MSHTIEINPPTTVAELASRWAAFNVNLRSLERRMRNLPVEVQAQPQFCMPDGLAMLLAHSLVGWEGDKSSLCFSMERLIEHLPEGPSADGRFVHVEWVESRTSSGRSLDATGDFAFAAYVVALFESLLDKALADFTAASQQS